MGINNDIATLKLVPLFSTMDDRELSGIRAIMEPCDYAPGQVIIREGEIGDHFHIIAHGGVQFLTMDGGGQEIVLDEAGPGGFFGEMSMLTGEPRSARVRAVDRVTTLTLGRQAFFDFLMTHPHASIDVLTVIGRRLHRADAMVRQMVSRNVNKISDEKMTLGQRIADSVAQMMGSWFFIITQSLFLVFWVAINILQSLHKIHWDAYPFVFLNLVLAFQASYAGPIIMMSQNRSSEKDRLANEVDHLVNQKAEMEIGLIMRRLDDMERGMHHLHQEHCALLRAAVAPKTPAAGNGDERIETPPPQSS